MQLRWQRAWLLLAILVAVVLGSSRAAADDKVRAAVTYFHEPAANTALNVTHPQVSYTQDFGSHFGLDVGYDADIVSGATPQIFGVDIVSSATRFNDQRHHGALGMRFLTDNATFRVGGGFAGEKDYRSGTVSGGMTTDLFDRNTQLSIDYVHNFDRVCDANNTASTELLNLRALDSSKTCFKTSDLTTTRKLNIDTIQASVTQVVTPWMLLQGGVTGQTLHGFQANPYRQVLLGERAVQEHLPGVRNRIAPWLRGIFALKPIRGSIEASARGYLDSWALKAFTGEVAWNQYIVRPFVLRARARWHVQNSAIFYRDGNQYASGGPNGSYWAGDRELSALLNQVYGVKGTFTFHAKEKQWLRFIDAFMFSVKADFMMYRSLTKNPTFSPNYQRTAGILDAVIIQGQLGFDF